MTLMLFSDFTPFLSLHQIAWRPYKLRYINALHINVSYSPKDQSLKCLRKILRIGGAGKWHFLVLGFWLLRFSKKKFVFSQWKSAWLSYEVLHYGWCLQNLEKDFIRTIMHTTVIALITSLSWLFTSPLLVFL